MRRFVVLATALAVTAGLGALGGCRLSLEDDTVPVDGNNLSPSCMAAQTASDLAFIEEKIFATACTFSGCHNGANDDAGRMDLRMGMSHTSLVGKPSNIAPAYMLVAPSAPDQSYLLMMIQHLTPAEMNPPTVAPPVDIGYMPQNAGGAAICAPKREAIQRWIAAGAMP